MTEDEIYSFLAVGTRTGKLATVRPDGRPHVAPIWFVIDGRDLVFNTGDYTIKAKNLADDPRAAISVDDEAPPYAYVMLEGTVAISEHVEEMLPWATAIGRRYMGADRAEEFGRRNAVVGEILVRFTPEHIVGHADMAE